MDIEVKDYNKGDVLIGEDKIKERLESLAKQIAEDYKDTSLLIVGILKGACMVISDLQKALYKSDYKNFQISFVTVKSYFSATESSKNPHLVQDIDSDPEGAEILLVDDIIDTGISLRFVHHTLKDRGAKSVKSLALLSKPDRREVDYKADYVGFIIPNIWVEGYGMDSDEKGRGNPNIIVGPSEV